jgi:hypothetical protein
VWSVGVVFERSFRDGSVFEYVGDANGGAMKLVAYLILLVPTLWALTDAIRRPADGFPAGRKSAWIVVLVVGAGTMFALLPPCFYFVAVRLKGGPPTRSRALTSEAHTH